MNRKNTNLFGALPENCEKINKMKLKLKLKEST